MNVFQLLTKCLTPLHKWYTAGKPNINLKKKKINDGIPYSPILQANSAMSLIKNDAEKKNLVS